MDLSIEVLLNIILSIKIDVVFVSHNVSQQSSIIRLQAEWRKEDGMGPFLISGQEVVIK